MSPTMNGGNIVKSSKDYVGYDYKTVTVDNEKVSFYLDAYANFGWIQDDGALSLPQTNQAVLRLKRDRKIISKAELTRLQQHFEACMDEIKALENSKTRMAIITSLVLGLLGTAFIAGAVFAITSDPPLIWLCVLLGLPGAAGWALSYPIYTLIRKKRTTNIEPLIERKFDEAHEILTKGNSLVRF